MTVTESLLRVFRVDQQLSGLQSRLSSAEKFLGEQSKQILGLESKRQSLDTQFKQAQATSANHAGESQRLETRINQIRELMNNAKTSKEHKALLTEVNTLKADKDKSDELALKSMAEVDAVKKQLDELDGQKDERSKVKQVASSERDNRANEIRDKVNELKAERQKLAAEVPAEAIKLYTALTKQFDDEAMAPVEEQDRKSHDFNCGRCMMAVPVETVSSLMRGGKITRCVSCGVILFIEPNLREQLLASPMGKKKTSKAAEAS